MCHLVGRQKTTAVDNLGQVFDEYRLVVEYDFILSIVAGRQKPISLEKVQKFFFWLRDKCNYRFGLITADTWGSVMPLQMLAARGFEVKVQSLDRKKDPYYTFRNAFQELRVRLYRQAQFMREIENLIETPDMINHPDASSVGKRELVTSSPGKDTCFSGDTLIRTVDQKVYRLDQFEAGYEVEVFAMDQGCITTTTATFTGVVGTEELLEVLLVDNYRVRATLDHEWMLEGGSYRRTDQLVPGDLLRTLEPEKIDGEWRHATPVLKVTAKGVGDIYCLKVPKFHNFLLEAGVFAHNCDGAAGALFAAMNNADIASALSTNSPLMINSDTPAGTNEAPLIVQALPPSSRVATFYGIFAWFLAILSLS